MRALISVYDKTGLEAFARGLADAIGELRIVHCPRQHQRTDEGRRDAHRLVVSCALPPLGELALD